MRHLILTMIGSFVVMTGCAGEPAPATVAGVQSTGTQVAPTPRPSGAVVFLSVRDLQQTDGGLQPQLRGGRVADSRDWPASLYTTFQTPKGLAACTAALIGPRVMLTAAHCVPSNGGVSFTFAEATYKTVCEVHPRYAASLDDSADFALCRLDRDFAEPASFIYETVSTSSLDLLPAKTIILSGYGCTSSIVGAGAPDGKYRIGFGVVKETSNSSPRSRHSSLYAPSEVNNLITADDPALANLCPGDSGGPAFLRTNANDQFSGRVVIGVNSRVFYLDKTQTSYGASLVSATGGPDFLSWARGWAAAQNVSACGIAGALVKCRT